MFRFIQKQGRGLLVLLAVMSIALSACSGSSATAAPATANNGSTPAANNGATPAANNGATPAANNGGSGLSGAASAFSSISSYKFKMTLAGGEFGSMLSDAGRLVRFGQRPGDDQRHDRGHARQGRRHHHGRLPHHRDRRLRLSRHERHRQPSSRPQATGTSMADSFSPATMFSSFVGDVD